MWGRHEWERWVSAREGGAGGRAACRALPGVFQGDDGEDGPPVHAPHARAVTHVVVVDGGTIRADLSQKTGPRSGHPAPGGLQSP